VGATARLHPYYASWDLRRVAHYLRTGQSFPGHDFPVLIHAYKVKNAFAQIDANDMNFHLESSVNRLQQDPPLQLERSSGGPSH
jgi:hypothetical protein